MSSDLASLPYLIKPVLCPIPLAVPDWLPKIILDSSVPVRSTVEIPAVNTSICFPVGLRPIDKLSALSAAVVVRPKVVLVAVNTPVLIEPPVPSMVTVLRVTIVDTPVLL